MAEIVIVPSSAAAGVLVADEIVKLISARPDAVLGLATGSTPLPVYEALRPRVAGVDLSQVRGFALDEYVGIAQGHPQSYHEVIRRTVTEPMGLDPARVHVPDGFATDLQAACRAYEDAIKAVGGVDIQFLGVGSNGHIGFNEPTSSLSSRTRIKALAAKTLEDNARFFDSIDDVPMHCITQGLGTILEAGHLFLLAFGEGKAAAVAAAVEGPVTSSLPGSAIQLHPHVTVVVDEAAASQLAHADYYRYAFANKPAWQGL